MIISMSITSPIIVQEQHRYFIQQLQNKCNIPTERFVHILRKLKEYGVLKLVKAKKEERSNPQSNPLEPPKKREDYIDFSKNQDDSIEKQEKKHKKSPQEIEQAREERRQKQIKIKAKIKALLLKIRAVALNKKFLICVGVIILAVALAFAVRRRRKNASDDNE